MSTIKTLKKISVKELFGLKRNDDGKAKMQELVKSGHKEIFVISGRVTGFASKATQYGESFALLGQFLARNQINGDVFKATKCYLPKDFTENVIGTFQNRSDESGAIEFTANVSVVEDSSSATGYTYIVEPVTTAESMAWEAKAMQSLLAIPAPEKPKAIKKAS